MSFLGSLIAWANVPFTIALGVTVLFALLQASGLLGLLAGDGHGEGDHDVDHDVDAGGDHDVDADGGDDHDPDHGADHEHGALGFAASLGVGRVPFAIVWQTYGTVFAITGLALNAVHLGRTGSVPLHTLAWTLPVALASGYGVTRLVAQSLAHVIDDRKHAATSRGQLVGAVGRVISSRVDDAFGEVRLTDRSGHVVRVMCCTRDGRIAEGADVVVVEHDAARDVLFVSPMDSVAVRPRR